jgi:hypothetical protein
MNIHISVYLALSSNPASPTYFHSIESKLNQKINT